MSLEHSVKKRFTISKSKKMNELAVLFMLEIFDLQACLVKYCRAANNKTVCSCMFSAEETFLHIS